MVLQSLVLSVTYQCPIKCRYCGVNAGPHRKERMSLEYMKRMIDEVYSFGVVDLVVFTGGEPFMLGDDLYKAVEYAAEKGFITRIVTNAYWATSFERACQVLAKLKDLGLHEVNYSCDDFHQEFIPLENIRWANEAAIKVGIPALIASKGIKNSTITPEYLEKFFGRELARFQPGSKNPPNNILSYGITVPVGWESEQLTDEDLFWFNQENQWKRPCASVLKDIVITPGGKLAICCGIGSDDIPETIVGDTKEKPLLELLMEANNDLFVNWLALEGPYDIMNFIRKQAPEIPFREQYVNICHLCHDILTRKETRAFLQATAAGRMPILSLKRAWLEAHRDEIVKGSSTKKQNQKRRKKNGNSKTNSKNL